MDLDESCWQQVLTAALLGTERQPFTMPSATGQLGQLLTQLGQQSPEATLLTTAATLALHHRAGWLPASAPVLPQTVCPPDDRPPCNPRATRILQQMLEGQYPQVLPEWLALAAHLGQRVPERYLPELLDLGQQQRALRAAILPVLGERGRWLAAQNPDWHYAVTIATEADWATGNTAARLLCLQTLRAHQPDLARALLEETWSQESASNRAKFLATFRLGLSSTDEPFLVGGISDRSKDVQRIAADLLASLPDSRQSAQMTTYVTRYITLHQTQPPTLTVELPTTLDAALIQLGIEPKLTKQNAEKLGEKAWWLFQMIGATPLCTWTDRWQMTPPAIVALTQSHDWQRVLLDGFALAAKRQKNAAWLEAIFAIWLAHPGSTREVARPDLGREELFQALPPEPRDALLANLLRLAPDRINEPLTIELLCAHKQPWSLDLADVVLDSLAQYLHKTNLESNWAWQLCAALKQFGQVIPISMIAKVEKLLTQLAEHPTWLQNMQGLLVMLQFRSEMMQAFERSDGI